MSLGGWLLLATWSMAVLAVGIVAGAVLVVHEIQMRTTLAELERHREIYDQDSHEPPLVRLHVVDP